MNGSPVELPDLLLFDGDWNRYVELVYQRFRQDLVESDLFFQGLPVRLRKRPLSEGKEEAFWHLVSEGPAEADRVPDLRRCERIGWIRWLIEAGDSGRLPVWASQRERERSLVIALRDFSYVVVRGDRRRFWLLRTAYPINQDHQRKKKLKEWEAAQK